MAWTLSEQVVDLYIKQYSNGITTYTDQNGQMYMPLDQPILINDADSSIINSNVNLERAIIFAAISLILVLLGGITSGLNVSLLSIDAQKNEIFLKLEENKRKKEAAARKLKNNTSQQNNNLNDNIKNNNNKTEPTKSEMIKKIQPLIIDRHLLLVTLLVANASAMEALPIFLDELVVSWLAVVISVSFVLIFGEILPQAFFSSDAIKSGYKMYYIVLFMKWILFPICKPIAFILDLLFGKEHTKKGVTFTHNEVKYIMNEIEQHPDQKTVVEGALNIGGYNVMHSIIPWNEVDCLNSATKLDANGLKKIYQSGRSRIPIFENKIDNIIGILLVKTLILCDPDPKLTLKEYLIKNFRRIPQPALLSPTTTLYDTINIFQAEKTHFALICNKIYHFDIMESWREEKCIPHNVKWDGIITLEDIMEDIIQEDIDDEFDMERLSAGILRINSISSYNKEEYKSNWTDDISYIESVTSRFAAKNKRTLRAKKVKTQMENLRISNNDGLDIIEQNSEINKGQLLMDDKKIKQSLSAENVAINVKSKDYGTIITSNEIDKQ